jgi:Rieske Fe-S protein
MDRQGHLVGHIHRLIANQTSRQIEAAILQLENGREVVVPATTFSELGEGSLLLECSDKTLATMPTFDRTRFYPLHPVEWQEEWGAVQGEILSLYPPLDRDERSRRRFILASLAIMGAIAASLAYPVFRYLVHPLTKAAPRLWAALKLRTRLKDDSPVFIPYTVERVEGYLEETITKGVWVIKPSPALASKIASRRENMEFPQVGWANKPTDPVAFATKCPHLGCNVRWVAEEGHFICACHNSHFQLDGSVISGPAPRGMDTLPVRTDRGQLEVMDMEFRAGIKEKKRSA